MSAALPDPQPIPSEVRDAGLAAGMGVVSAGLGLWWLTDKVRDSVNASDHAENKPAQSPHDDVPPQA